MVQTEIKTRQAPAMVMVVGREKLQYIDALRVIAALAVVMLHTAHLLVINRGSVAPSSWWAGNVIDSAMRWCVPVFVLVSGALLLDPSRQESFGEFARKRARRILAPLVFWSAVYLVWRVAFEGLAWRDIPGVVLQGIPYYHLWYLYMVPGLYLLTPFLRTYIRGSTQAERWLLVAALLILAAVNGFIYYFVRPDTQSFFTLFVPYLAYYLAGYQLRNMARPRLPSLSLVAGLLGLFALTAMGTGLLVQYVHDSVQDYYLYDYFSPFVMAAALLVFLLVRNTPALTDRMSARLARALNWLGPATLGIYLVHPLLLAILQRLGALNYGPITPLLAIPAVALAVFAISLLITRVFMRLPILKETVA